MGLLTFLFSWIPFLNFLTTTVMGLLGLIFSIVGIAKGKSGGRGKAIAGLILTLLGIIIFVVEYVILFSAASTELGDIDYDDIFSDLDFEDIDFEDINCPSSDTDDFVIDGSFATPDNGYVTGVLHIEGFRVDF